MESGMPRVCIVVAEPRDGSTLETVAALERLGSGARVVRTHSARECLAHCESDDVDLVVVDRALGAEGDPILEARPRPGPPVVVVDANPSDERALEAFRLGAADCIAASADYAEVLPVVALEQIPRRKPRRQGWYPLETSRGWRRRRPAAWSCCRCRSSPPRCWPRRKPRR